MRAGFFTLLAVALAACSQIPTQNRTLGGDIISQGASDYAVFAEHGAAVAIRMGYAPVTADTAPAIAAIKRATGCNVVVGSITYDPKSVSAELACRDTPPPSMTRKPHL